MTAVKTLPLALLLSVVVLLGPGAGCAGDVDLDPGLAPTLTGVIAGDAVVAVPLADAHPVVVFLLKIADADGLLLPQQVTADVSVIPEFRFAEGASGVRTGPFAFGLVPPGTYVVAGIVDVDENFNLLVPALAVPTAADLLGGYVDLATGALIPVPIEPGQLEGEVTVMFATAP